MLHRWLASTLMYCEKNFMITKGYQDIQKVIKTIEQEQQGNKNIIMEMRKAS